MFKEISRAMSVITKSAVNRKYKAINSFSEPDTISVSPKRPVKKEMIKKVSDQRNINNLFSFYQGI
ncbi:hypothetical protein CNR22_14145 [Sphingobacteriaceae bacterium]|nr:hypothetical protein CNR22_14145 [Sphingobacteriaceae bacterium]